LYYKRLFIINRSPELDKPVNGKYPIYILKQIFSFIYRHLGEIYAIKELVLIILSLKNTFIAISTVIFYH